MLINEPCDIKEAKVVDSTVIKENKSPFVERTLLNKILDLQGQSPIADIDLEEKSQERGIILLLHSPRTNQKYERFMPESLIQDMLGENAPILTDENLEFFAEKLRNRNMPINITVFNNEIESEEYQNAEAASPTGDVKFRSIGKSKKKGK